MANKITCTCGHSWDKSSSSKKDMKICHICGKDNTMKNGGWLDSYDEELQLGGYVYPVNYVPQAQKGYSTGDIASLPGVRKEIILSKEELAKNKKAVEDRVKAENAKTLADRKVKIKASEEAKKKPMSAKTLAEQTQATGDKFRLFPDDPNSFIDDYLNPGVFIGDMASGLGRVPLNIQQGNYGQAALDVAAPLAAGALAGVGAKGTSQFVNNLVNPLAGFKSDINWGAWNKEIPGNEALMKEYNSIERSAKARGTWMKNLDGTPFEGTPEQFVQQNSQNFKKAYPKGFSTGYRGAHQHVDDFTKRDRNDYATFLTDNIENAKSYASESNGRFFQPEESQHAWQDGLYELAIPSHVEKVTGNAGGRNWRLVDYDDKIAKGTLQKGYVDQFQDELKNNAFKQYGLQDYNSSKQYLSTDAYANYIKNPRNSEAVAEIKQVNDQMGFSKDIPSNTVYAVDANRVPLKSLRYNNGMFDMTNPNIYKSILPYAVPAAIGAGAIQQKRNGGWLNKYETAENGIEGTMGGLTDQGFNYNGAWGGPSMQDGGKESLNLAKMRSKMAIAAAFGNPSAKRMTSVSPSSYRFSGNEMIDGDPVGVPPGETGTHYMASMGEYAVPYIQEGPNGKLQFKPNASFRDREAIRFDNPKDARYFAEHYKEVAPMMKRYAMGGNLAGAVGSMYARTGAPSKGPRRNQTDVTDASAQNGMEMKFYQEGLDWKPRNISQDGSKTKKKKTLILAENDPELWNDKYNKGKVNPFITEAAGIKKYVNEYFPDEDVEIVPAYKDSFNEALKRSDANTRLVTLAHAGNNLFGVPVSEYLQSVSKTPYQNCYAGTCYGDDIVEGKFGPTGIDTRNLNNFNVRSGHISWSGFAPVNRGGEEGFKDSFFRRSKNPEIAKLQNEFTSLSKLYDLKSIDEKKFIEKSNELNIKMYNAYKKHTINQEKATDVKTYKFVPYPARTDNDPLRFNPQNILQQKKQGGEITKDDMGYWNPENWGEPVEIGSNEITMDGVYEPLLGISDTGDTQMMYPGEDYKFKGKKVTEYPIKKNGGWLEKYAEGGDVSSDKSYDIQKGDTLSNISSRYNIPLATLANANQLQNPNLIQAGKKLNIPTQAKKELTFDEIPTTDSKKVVIDNFSKHYDYIVEGNNVYYKTKGGKTWADISDNKGAQSNLLKFLDKNNYWAGYNSGEKELLQTGQVPKKQQVQIDLPKLTPINTRATADATQVAKSLTKPTSKSTIKEEPSVFDALTDYVKHQVDDLGIKSKKLEKTLEDEVKKIKSSVEKGVVKTGDRAEELFNVGINGIKRKFATHTGIDDDTKIAEAPKTNKPKTISEYYGNKTGAEISAVIDVPDGSGRQFKQQVLPTSSIKFGVRNRGEFKDIKTDGLEVTTFNPFTKNKLPDNETVIAVDSSGNLNVGKYKDFKDNKNFMWSPTTMNYVTGIATDKNGKIAYKKSKKNPAYVSPITNVINDPNGKKQGSLNILVNQNKNGDYYGSVQGGRILVKNPDTNETLLISGSMNKVKSEFERIKGKSKYLEVYNVDNGTYSRGLSYKDKKLTPERLKKYDEENLDGGGNGLYIIDYKQPVSKFKEEYVEGMPNVRTEKDESYKKGHSLKNEIKNIVLHHTAYTGPNAEKEVTAQYMSPGQNTSHIVIQKNGKRSVYASPEQVTFHAGQSKWNNRDNVNDFSIGVEFQGDTNKQPLTKAQIESFVEYYTPIAKKYNLSLKDIITHQMIAPGRKPDIAEKEYQRILKYMKENNLK